MSRNVVVRGGGDRMLHEAMICRQCEAGLACAFRVPLTAVRSAHRQGAPAALARAGAMYLAATGFHLSGAALGRAFGRHRSTIDHACRRIEARREADPGFETAMDCLEQALSRRIVRLAGEAQRCAGPMPEERPPRSDAPSALAPVGAAR